MTGFSSTQSKADTATESRALRTVNFYGDEIVTFERSGVPYVAMRRIVENMGMAWASQHPKLMAQKSKFSCHDIVTTGSDGKAYGMLCMPVDKLQLWLVSINPNKVRDATIRAKVERYQAESAIVLHDFWTKGAAGGSPDALSFGEVERLVEAKLASFLPALIDAASMKIQFGVTRDTLTAGQVCDLAKVPSKGRRGLIGKVSNALRRYCARVNVAPREAVLGAATAYVFPMKTAREWLDHEGRDIIKRYLEAKAGQTVVKLVGKAEGQEHRKPL